MAHRENAFFALASDVHEYRAISRRYFSKYITRNIAAIFMNIAAIFMNNAAMFMNIAAIFKKNIAAIFMRYRGDIAAIFMNIAAILRVIYFEKYRRDIARYS